MSAIRKWAHARGWQKSVELKGKAVIFDSFDSFSRGADSGLVLTGIKLVAPDPVLLLWALAFEIDDRQATRTGYRVCRACGGRGEVIARVVVGPETRHTLRLTEPITIPGTSPTIVDQWSGPMNVIVKPCPCDGPTRPDTADLARMVGLLATLGEAPYGDLPDRWQVHLDAMLAGGLGDVVLPGETRTTPAWMCRWWSAFNEWCVAGRLPDADALAADLDALTPVVLQLGRGSGKTQRMREWSEMTTKDVAALVGGDALDDKTVRLPPGSTETQRMAEMVGDTYARRGTVGGIRDAIMSVETVLQAEVYDHRTWPLPVEPNTVHVSWTVGGFSNLRGCREAVEAAVDRSLVLGVRVIYEPWIQDRRAAAWNDAVLREVMRDERFSSVRWLALDPPTFEMTDYAQGTVTARFAGVGPVRHIRYTITVVALRIGHQVGEVLSVEAVEDHGEW